MVCFLKFHFAFLSTSALVSLVSLLWDIHTSCSSHQTGFRFPARKTPHRAICLPLLEWIACALHRKIWKNKDTLFWPQMQDSLVFLSHSHCLLSDQNIQVITISDGSLWLVTTFFSTLWSYWHFLLWPSCKAGGQQPARYFSWNSFPPLFQKTAPKLPWP